MSANELNNIRGQAALWVARLHDTDLSDTQREELHRWLLADPRHATEFRAHNAILGLARELPPDLHARLSAFAPASPDSPVQSGRRRWMGMFALAAALLLTLSAGGWLFLNHGQLMSQTYATRTGETRTITFEDGSVAYLNTRTRLKWIGTLSDRRVALLEGEALFDVVHDPERPFHVVLDNSEIRVLGTRFNVYR
jgi:transmembrane sensor